MKNNNIDIQEIIYFFLVYFTVLVLSICSICSKFPKNDLSDFLLNVSIGFYFLFMIFCLVLFMFYIILVSLHSLIMSFLSFLPSYIHLELFGFNSTSASLNDFIDKSNTFNSVKNLWNFKEFHIDQIWDEHISNNIDEGDSIKVPGWLFGLVIIISSISLWVLFNSSTILPFLFPDDYGFLNEYDELAKEVEGSSSKS